VKANTYELTDGTLESAKTNAQLTVFVHKGMTGRVSVFARYNPAEFKKRYYYYDDDDPYRAPGFGIALKGLSFTLFTPGDYYSTTTEMVPYRERIGNVPDLPKQHLAVSGVVQANGYRLEMFVNGKREKLCVYRVGWEGSYAIEVKGTATIELPQIVGQ
jgi:hypothetical protein